MSREPKPTRPFRDRPERIDVQMRQTFSLDLTQAHTRLARLARSLHARSWIGEIDFLPVSKASADGSWPKAMTRTITRPTLRDSKADTLHPEARTLYDTANAAYLSMKGRRYPFLQLDSALRTVAEQLALYAGYKFQECGHPTVPTPPAGQPRWNPANPPGLSLHEYGLAIDVVYRDDAKRVRAALSSTGWETTIKREPWHFEARGIASWSFVVARIDEVRQTGAPATIRDSLERLCESARYLQSHQDRYNNGVAILRAKYPGIFAEYDRLEREHNRLTHELQTIEADVRVLENERVSLDRESRRLQRLKYDLCPNRHPFTTCTHTALKNKWLTQRNKQTQRHSARLRSFDKRVMIAHGRRDQTNNRLQQAQLDQRQLIQDSAQLRKNEKQYFDFRKEYEQQRHLFTRYETRFKEASQAVSDAVTAVRSGQPARPRRGFKTRP